MQALGLIETKGLLAAIECADTMLKAADVRLLERTFVGGGLVSVLIDGDVGAVQAAVDAGASAVRKLDERLLITKHVIPRPHEELEGLMISSVPFAAELSSEQTETEETPRNIEEVLQEENIEPEQGNSEDEIQNFIQEDMTEKSIESELTDMETAVIEESNPKKSQEEMRKEESNKNKYFFEIPISDINKEIIDTAIEEKGLEITIESLKMVKITKLRTVSHQYQNFGLTSKSISKCSKKQLLAKFKEYYANLQNHSEN